MQTFLHDRAGVPFEFLLFAAMLIGLAAAHRHSDKVVLGGLTAIVAYKIGFSPFGGVAGVPGLARHLSGEWVLVTNLLALLVGFAVVARHFEATRLPILLPRALPDGWKGGLGLLAIVFVLSSFLDNIAAALIGATMAKALYRGRVHVGFLAAIVAAANGGGSGSVIGDTTTTMMWIAGVRPGEVVEAYVAAVPALLFFGVVAARQQHALQPIVNDTSRGVRVAWAPLAAVAAILAATVGSNVVASLFFPGWLERLPIVGAALWLGLLLTAPLARPDWRVVPPALRGSLVLLGLVLAASMMPVASLPPASWPIALGLGFVSAVFDNIPLTAIALRQGGHDWGFLAYAVGLGGSMLWFGSSAGIALATVFPQARSARAWLRHGWHVAVAYVLGFAVLLLVVGWHAAPAG